MKLRTVGIIFVVAALAACGGSSGSSPSPTTLTLTAGAGSLRANGIATTSITVSGQITYPLVVRTTLGAFENGQQNITLATGGATAAVTLRPCDSAANPACAGTAQVSASDSALATGRTVVTFLPLEVCNDGIDNDGNNLTDCADTAACPSGTSCGPHGQKCAGGACACPTGNTETCGDGVDNNCDGLVDCADPQCQPHGGVAGAKCDTGLTGVGGAHVLGACTAAGACTCSGSGKETTCGDGLDNNCNGLIDCDDPDCQPVGNALGGSCDSKGNTCAPVVSGRSTCARCAPGGDATKYQPTETSCGDGVDNDCNGLSDCQDPACANQGLSCSTTGMVCTAQLTCQCPSTAGVETSCSDGVDNDCNGFIDCKDLGCNGKSCGPHGLTCATTANGTGGCTCPAGAVEICNDGIDNNCDGLVDCGDPTCQPTTPGGSGKDCKTVTLVQGARCDAAGQCTCPGGQSREASCADGVDNDCNGFIDCKDVACNGQSCGGNGQTCQTTANGSGSCVCPGGTTESCSDGVDNNCDGLVDCADPQCQASGGQACNPADSSYKCTDVGTSGTHSWVCKSTKAFTLTVTASPTRIAADGAAQAAITVVLKDTSSGSGTGTPVAGATVTLAAAPLGSVTSSVVTDATGTAIATFRSTSLTSSGDSTVTATYTYGAPAISTLASATVTLPQLSSMTLVAQQYQVMGASGSGYQEQNTLTFRLLDSSSAAYPAGLTVTFEHQPLQGSFLGTVKNCTPLVNPTLCTATGVTDASGNVTVLLHSGQTAGVVSVTARAQAGSASSVQYTATNIAIVGAKASGAEIAVTCSPRNIPALTSQDCTNSSYYGADARTTCTVTLADRYKNALGVATVATFETEAGIAGPPANTPPYDTTRPPLQQTGLGVAQDYVSVSNAKLPADVAPFVGEYSYTYDADGCGLHTHNPRDGLVTVIVKVRGEEGFVDGSNGCPRDGVYNAPGSVLNCAGEFFIDIGEPFVDYNDNGIRDTGEPYDDINGNGVWDGPNGVWDADTTIWAQTRILYTSYLTNLAGSGADAGRYIGSRFYSFSGGALPPAPTLPTSFAVFASQSGPPPVPATSTTVPLFVTDQNYNLPNYKYAYTSAKSGGANIVVGLPADGVPTTLDGLGMSVVQHYCSVQAPTNPAVQCSGSCTSAPCYAVLDVTNFEYGQGGYLGVTGGSTPDGGLVCGYVTGSLTTTNTVSNITTTVNTTMGVCGTDQ